MDGLPLLGSRESGNILYRAKINCVLNNIFKILNCFFKLLFLYIYF
jgi:hypothetical protein